jgi:ribosomal protein L37E
MNKQIEEMAKIINESEILCRTCGESTYTYCSDAIAEYLYNADYRKSTDVAREIFEEIEKTLTKNRFRGTSCLLHDIAELKKKYESEGEIDVN